MARSALMGETFRDLRRVNPQDAFPDVEPNQEDTSIGAQWTYNDGSSYPDPTIDAGLGRRHGKRGGDRPWVDGRVEVDVLRCLGERGTNP